MAAQIRVSGVRSIRNLALVSLAAGVPRVIGALFFGKEAFGDAYCYIEQVSAMRGKMVAGTFSVADLSGFWLPLYQFVCAIISIAVNQPLYVGRFVSAVAGTGVCILVYLCSLILTSSQRWSVVAALAIALNPFHLQYSYAAMTDIPHALVVMACMYFVLKERWTLAACLGAAAGLVRVDSWLLVALVPAIQFMRQRKVPILSILILSFVPAFWLFVCWKATGDALASFHAHDQYVLARIAAHPGVNRITFLRTMADADRLLYSMNIAVLVGCFTGLWFVFRDWRKSASHDELLRIPNLLVCLLYFFAYLGFFALAYLTKNQSDIWPRYGLILFALGMPVLAYSLQQSLKHSSVVAKAALGTALVIGLVQFKIQAEDLTRFASQTTRAYAIANYLKQEYASDRSIKVFCDSPEVRVLSGIPREQFFDSSGGAPKDNEGFLGFLRAKGVKFLMIPEEPETSTPSQLFPGLVKDAGDVLEGVIPAPDDQRTDSLYRVRAESLPPPR
jgi:hypothetical protein